ncbi:BA14K family protein [Phyllobacterium sp. 21LDTY02-6]|uniref:BA14K family protein n=1 Tax=Phyllobacterium sp. 21LDTY02-6 TaxID=2944903 RepID=UPI00202053FA|nr:BA14K family protein [Phyllobacterium sp. 21LDTY02-6]MCO4316177.1 BA14K family protein [Phyllobacterium sp. 21LDTY02-6]
MKKLTSFIAAAVMTFGTFSTGALPVYAAPITPPAIETGNTPLLNVQHRRHWRGDRGWRGDRHWRGGRHWRGERRWHRNRHWRGHRYGGYRGYRYHRPGYRYYDGAWFPLAAFGTGVVIGSTINRPVYRGARSHTQWCYNRYRSYRAYDNTYQPYNGPRRQCVSPY